MNRSTFIKTFLAALSVPFIGKGESAQPKKKWTTVEDMCPEYGDEAKKIFGHPDPVGEPREPGKLGISFHEFYVKYWNGGKPMTASQKHIADRLYQNLHVKGLLRWTNGRFSRIEFVPHNFKK